MLKYLIFDRGDTIITDLPEQYGGMAQWPYYKAVDGVIETMPYLANEYICVMASNTSVSDSDTIKMALTKIGIDKYFKEIYTQIDLKYPKPKKEFFLALLEILKATPSEVCSIGNDYELDIKPAKQLGIHTILLTDNNNSLENADYNINDFREIQKTLTKIKSTN